MHKTIDNLNDFQAKFWSELSNPYSRTLGVRIILVDSFEVLRSIEKELLHLRRKTKYLEDYIPEGKNWLSINDIKNLIEDFIKKNDIVYLFSLDNLLRFYSTDELNSLLPNILRIRTNKGYAILPLAGLKERIKDIKGIREFYKDLIYEVTATGKKVKMFVLNPKINIKLKCVEDFREFLGCWRLQNTEIYVKNRVIYSSYKNAYPDTAVDVVGIENYKDVLRKVVGFKDKIYFTDKNYEKGLAEEVLEKNLHSFKDMFPSIKDFADFVKHFLKERNELKRKSLLNLAYNYMSGYKSILKEDKVAFLKNIYRGNLDQGDKYRFLSIAIKADSSFERLLCEELDESIKKENIIGILECEKKKALELITQGKISLEELQAQFEDFAAYLDTPKPPNLEENQKWVLDYMNLYKESKLRNKALAELESLLNNINRSGNFYNWYYSFKWILDIATEWKDEAERIVWIDALGFEWAGFVLNYLKSKGIPVHAFHICRANLPSITETNKPNFEVLEMREFDNLIHQRYKFPDSIIKEMNKLKEILDKEINVEKRTLIFSDHGSSALVRLHQPIKLSTGIKFEHGGRFFRGPLGYEPKEVIKHTEGVEYFYVATTHKSIGTKPQGEAHGGATPEEILTFALIVGGQEEISYSVDLPEREISRRNNKLVVYIRPVPKVNVELVIDKKPVEYALDKERRYVIDLAGIRSGDHTLEIKIGSNIYREPFRIIGGLEEEEFLI